MTDSMKIAICSDHAGVEYKAKLISYLLVKEHNNANVLVMPARFISYQMAVSIVRAWPAGWRHL